MATTIRVEDDLHSRLRELSRQEHRPMGDVIDDAIKQYEREKFWQGVNEDLSRLQSNPADWADYQNEVAFFEGGVTDGLDQEPPYYSPEEEEEIRAAAARS